MRWLLAQGRIDEVIDMLKNVAQVNQKQVTDDIFKQFKVLSGDLSYIYKRYKSGFSSTLPLDL